MVLGKEQELFLGGIQLFNMVLDLKDDFADLVFKEGDEDIVFVVEVEVDCPVSDLGLFGNVRDTGIEKTFTGKNFNGSLGYLVVFVGNAHGYSLGKK